MGRRRASGVVWLMTLSAAVGFPGLVTASDTTFISGFEDAVIVGDRAGGSGWFTSIAIAADGNPIISQHDPTAGVLQVAHCRDPGCSRAVLTKLDGGGSRCVGPFNSIAIGADGVPVISYWDQTAFALRVARCADPDCAGGARTVTLVDGGDPLERAGLYTSIAIGVDGLPIISYTDDSLFAVKVAKCNDPACAGGDETISVIDDRSAEFVGLYTSIAIGADGLPLIAYYSTAGSLHVVKCDDLSCAGGGETISTIDDPEHRVGWDPSIAIGADGVPVISYHDVTAGTLRVARCSDLACGGALTITTLIHPGYRVGTYSSLAIGPDGLPVIAYYDATAGALLLAHCGDAACAAGNSIVSLDSSTHRVGRFSSLAIGADGLPVISYRDDTAGVLRVARCQDPACGAASALD